MSFTNNNCKFDENGGKFSKRVEITVGKGAIASHKQFSFSHCVYKRLVPQTRKNQGLFGKGLADGLLIQVVSNTSLTIYPELPPHSVTSESYQNLHKSVSVS